MINCVYFFLDDEPNIKQNIKQNTVSRYVKLNVLGTNEISVLKRIKLLPNCSKHFHVFESIESVKFASIDNSLQKQMQVQMQTQTVKKDNQNMLLRYADQKLIYLDGYLRSLSCSRKYIYLLTDFYARLLKNINLLVSSNIIHNNIGFKTIVVNSFELPILTNFRFSLDLSNPDILEYITHVFIQYNRKKDGTLEPLAATHVDTGMGFERLVRVIQGKQSNYDTDVFSGTISKTAQIVNKIYKADDSKESVAFRVLADHIRAISFTIADGQLPSNTGAGYVIRRILRRAVRYYYSYLNYKQPLLHQLLPIIATQFEDVFPELKAQESFVAKVIKEEEEGFLRTLDKGLKRIEDVITASQSSKIIDGRSAFELNDTFGFPIDLTKLIAAENHLAVDEEGYEAARKEQQERGRTATALETEDWINVNTVAKTTFVGYDSLEAKTKIVKYRKVSGKGKELYQIVLENTPFYAESGGQVGDSGELKMDSGELKVIDTKKENDLIIHFTESILPEMYGEVIALVDADRRKEITVHHSVTHLMQAALRQVLGNHVAQKGSLNNEEYLRFDFSHFAKVTDAEIAGVEKLVNEKIRQNIPVVIKEMKKDDAVALGAMALFGEKYGDSVRVVIMDEKYSIELCGGTHVGHTGELGLFKITSESAIAAGVRRIEAVCGKVAEKYVNQNFEVINEIGGLLKNPADIAKSIENLQAENTSLKKHIEALEARQLVVLRNELLQKDEIINNVTFIGDIVEVSSADNLKKLCFDLKTKLNDYVAVLCCNIDGKPFVAVGISDTVVVAKNLDASKIIKEHIAPLIKGGGGGQKTLATAGGQYVGGLREVIERVKALL